MSNTTLPQAQVINVFHKGFNQSINNILVYPLRRGLWGIKWHPKADIFTYTEGEVGQRCAFGPKAYSGGIACEKVKLEYLHIFTQCGIASTHDAHQAVTITII